MKNESTRLFFEEHLEKFYLEKKKLLWDYQKRCDIRKTVAFSKTNDLWNDGHFNISKNIGQICELTKDYEKKSEAEHKVFSIDNWEEYYLEYGKTFLDIYELSSQFVTYCNKRGVTLTEEEALNYCYIRIIDESYIGMERERNTLLNFRKRFPDFDFRPTSKGDDVVYGIDIALYLNDDIIHGFQVKSQNALKRKRVIKENNIRFKKCHNNYGFFPDYLISGEKGEILAIIIHKDNNRITLEGEKIDNYINEVFKNKTNYNSKGEK